MPEGAGIIKTDAISRDMTVWVLVYERDNSRDGLIRGVFDNERDAKVAFADLALQDGIASNYLDIVEQNMGVKNEDDH